jgi:SOS-response transcriptional repressor LexA
MMTKIPLTDRQNQVLTIIDTFSRTNGYPPSVREVMRALGLKNPGGIQGHIMALRKKGWIKQVARGPANYPARSLVVLPDGIQVGDRIQKRPGAPGKPVAGTAVASFTTTDGVPYFVLEDDLGGLHVYSSSMIVRET